MASVEERYNQIINNVRNRYNKEQSVIERYNKIVNNVNNMRERRYNASMNAINSTTNNFNNGANQTENETTKKQQSIASNMKNMTPEEQIKYYEATTGKKLEGNNLRLPGKNNTGTSALENLKLKSEEQMQQDIAKDISLKNNISQEDAIKALEEAKTTTDNNWYKDTFGKNGIFGVNAIVNEIPGTVAGTVESGKQALETLRDMSIRSAWLMGQRGGIANIVDAVTSETASQFDDYSKSNLKGIKGAVSNVAESIANEVDEDNWYKKAYNVYKTGKNIKDSVYGDGDNNITPGMKEYNQTKKKMQYITNNVLDKTTRKIIQDKLTSVTDSYYKDYQKYQELESEKGEFNQYADKVIEGTTRMFPSIAVSVATSSPDLGLLATGLSAKGSATQEALKQGATLEEANDVGNLSMLIEIATEKLFSGIKLPNGKGLYGKALGDTVEDFVIDKLKTKGGKWLASKGMDVAGEIVEELISDTLETVAKRMTYDKNAKLPTAKDYLDTATTTAGTTILLNLITGGLFQMPNVQHNTSENTENTEKLKEQVKKASDELTEKSNTSNLQQNSTINQNTSQQQQINQIENKNDLNQNMVTNEKQDTLKEKSFEDIVDEAMSNYEHDETKSPLQNRDIKTIGKEKINAYQYDNPEVKPFFQEMAQMLGEDVGNIASEDNRKTVKGGGTSLNTNVSAIKQLREMGYSYNQIIDGITNIINDNGKENNAISKKLEILIDDQLRNGYINSYGKYISPNEGYINLINKENTNVANSQQINDFSGYTQKEINNIKSNKISIAQSSEDISKFVNNSKKFPGNFKMYLGKIKENASTLIKNKLGINVDNYNISLKTDDVRKIFKDHGSKKTEIPRGQVPITEKDFLNIPDIINNPDSVSLEGKSPQGKPAIKFEKNIDGNTVVVTYVSDKHNNLEMQTMYKFKNNKKRDSATALHENQTPGLNTSEMDSGTNLFINNNIPQNQQNVKNLNLPTKETINQKSEKNKSDINLPQAVENKSNRVYNKVTAKEQNQIIREVMTWRLNENDGIHYIDLSKDGYNSYIYEKNGNSIIPIKKISGSEDFLNAVRKGVEDGTYKKSETINEWITTVKNESKNNRSSDVSLPKGKTGDRDAGLYSGNIREESASNRTGFNEENGGNGGLGNSSSFNLPKDEKNKVRKHYKSIIESPNTTAEAKAIAKELMGTDTYIPESNVKQLEDADNRISSNVKGADGELDSLMSRAIVGDKITSVDIAVGERLIQYYSKTGDKTKLRDAIQTTAMAGTTAGQTVQAMSLLNHQTPEGHAVWLQRSVEKMNNDLRKQRGAKAEQLTITDEMLDKILKSESKEELQRNLDEVYKELGQQISKTTLQKIDAWRYFSMLANPRTHIRNILGNFAMAKVQTAKNKVAGAVESVVGKFNPKMERTHTIVPASKEVKEFAKADIKNVSDRLGLTEGKLNPKSRIESNMKTFKHKALEKTLAKAFDLNNKALEVEDGWGLKAGYKNALAEYMTANKLKLDTITDAQLAKARNYAVQQAKEATFHQECQLASLINQLSNKNKFAKFGLDAVLPFKKTPINIAKTGIEYSPIGLAKSMVYDVAKLRKGNITVNQYIDNVSKGLTGTGIALVGYALASMGILKASGGDDDKEKYEQNLGKQTFSITIGDNTYSLDWLAPSAIPLFIGTEIYELTQDSIEKKTSTSSDEDSNYNKTINAITNVLDAFTNSMNPMMEMSMLSSLTSTLKSYEQGSSQFSASMGTNAMQSYVNQFIPTALGQIAKMTDEYERSTTSTKSGTLPKAIDSTKNQIMAKIPGLRQKLPVKTDIWGNEKKQSENLPLRVLENSIFPWQKKEISSGKVDKELLRLYGIDGNQSVIPDSSFSKNLTFSGQKYRMTSEEYAEYKKTYGNKSYEIISEMIKTNAYGNLNDEQKQKAIEKVYEYVKEYCKANYAKENDIDYKKSTLLETVEKLEKNGGSSSSYFSYLAKINGINGQDAMRKKINYLTNADYDKTTKSVIYENYINSDDELYSNVMKASNVDIDEYLKYKTKKFESDKVDDGTVTGKTVDNSKKKKVYEYVNSSGMTYEQKLLLLGTQYTLTASEKSTLAKYVNSLKITKKQKMEIYEKLEGFTVYKDGRVTY